MIKMISTFALHPAASKRLIARAAATLPQVQNAYQNGKIFIGHGSTNAALLSELTGIQIDDLTPYVSGVVSNHVPCATDAATRKQPWCIEKGKIIAADWLEFLDGFQAGDVFIKGANAVDPQGNVGILIGNPTGGTIGKSYGTLMARGIEIIHPVGLEKLVPSCREAQTNLGMNHTGARIGLQLGYIVLHNSTVITEIESIAQLFGLKARMIAAGGIGGMEGSVVLAVESDEPAHLEDLVRIVKELNQTPPAKISKKKCAHCTNPCMMKEE